MKTKQKIIITLAINTAVATTGGTSATHGLINLPYLLMNLAQAEEVSPCFMVNESGETIDLISLCGHSSSEETSVTPAAEEPTDSTTSNRNSLQRRYPESVETFGPDGSTPINPEETEPTSFEQDLQNLRLRPRVESTEN